MRHILIESGLAYEEVKQKFAMEKKVVWHTSSPFLLEQLRDMPIASASIEGSIGQAELNSIGDAALRIVKDWGRRLDATTAARRERLQLGPIVLPQLKLMIVPLLVKAVLAERWIAHVLSEAAAPPCVVGLLTLSPQSPSFMRFRNSDTLFLQILRRTRWANQLDFVALDGTPYGAAANGRRRSFIERWWALRSAGASKVCYVWWRRHTANRGFKLPWRTAGADVLLFGNNELIKETFVPLLALGARVGELRMPPAAGVAASHEPVFLPAERRELHAQLEDSFVALAPGDETASVRGAAALGSERLLAFLDVFVPYARQARQACGPLHDARTRDRVVLSHGLTDPVERLFYQFVRDAEVPVIEVQHGGSAGLTHIHQSNIDLAEINACEASVVYNRNFDDYYRAHLNGRMPPTLIAGAPSFARREAGWNSRWLARRYLGAAASERVVMYVTNMFYGNSLSLPHGHLDTHYYGMQRDVVCKGLAASSGRCFVKMYPGEARADRHPLTVCGDLPEHVQLIEGGDFRYLRMAIDLIILDVPYGTLGWALGCNVPTILLDLPFNPLLPAIVPRVEEALFRVDCSRQDWCERLQQLLAVPAGEMKRRWEGKRAARDAFVEQYLLGPVGRPGRKIAAFTLDFARRSLTATS